MVVVNVLSLWQAQMKAVKDTMLSVDWEKSLIEGSETSS